MRQIIEKKYVLKQLVINMISKTGCKQEAGGNAMENNGMTKSRRSFCGTKVAGICLGITFLIAVAFPAFAIDDDVPFFAEGAGGNPNVMFIFDNSDSMQDIPFLRKDTRPVRPGTDPESLDNSGYKKWKWQRGVQLYEEVNPLDGKKYKFVQLDGSGRVMWDDTAYPSDQERAIPTQEPDYLPGNTYPDYEGNFTWTGEADVNNTMSVKVLPKHTPGELPGYASLTGTVTSIADLGKICDTTAVLDWTNVLLSDDAIFNANYRYRLVEVYPDDYPADLSESPQVRMIDSRDVVNKCFLIDTSAAAGGALSYTVGKTYKYRILTAGPGRVTGVAADSATLIDADIDWNDVDSSWSGSWENSELKILAASGAAVANVDQVRTITGRSKDGKSWTVDSAFPVACDFSCQYEITPPATATSRIYDADLDWSTPDNVLVNTTKFESQYRYRAVEVRSKIGKTIQRRTILSRDITGKYFTIDIAVGAGGPLTYDQNEISAPGGGYTYTILTEGSGVVTRVLPGAGDETILTDANLDWTTIDSDFDSQWENRTILITEGTNEGESRIITNRSEGDKYWRVGSAFTDICDLTTRYKILGTSADDNRFAIGGNHPASKLYQAKKAVNMFLDSPTLKFCDEKDGNGDCIVSKYGLNIGFATYLSARVPRVHARYYKEVPARFVAEVTEWVPEVPAYTIPAVDGYWYTRPTRASRIKVRYKGFSSFWHEFITNDSGTRFIAEDMSSAPSGSTDWSWNREFTGVSVGFTFDRTYSCGQTIHYKVTNIIDYPGGDGTLSDRHKFIVESRKGVAGEGGYWWGTWRYFYGVAGCGDAPATNGAYTLINPGETCESCTFREERIYAPVWIEPVAAINVPAVPGYDRVITPGVDEKAYYKLKHGWIFNGRFNITDPSADYYVNRVTQMVTAPATYSSGWIRLDVDMMDVNINKHGAKGNLLANTFDASYFMYPGYGTLNRPHGWSYKKTVKDDGTPAPWIYGKSRGWSGAKFPIYNSAGKHNPSAWAGGNSWKWSKWGDAVYFPAQVGGEMSNTAGHDQVVFVNLPEYDSSDPDFGDDVDGNNFTKIKNYTSIGRTPNPDMKNTTSVKYDYTIMPYTDSIAPNAYTALAGSGTPIAASLKDLKEYYESYLAQDPKSIANCRKNYVIFLTDGKESGGGDPVEAARQLYEEIGVASSVPNETIKVATFVVGFGMDKDSQTNLNAIAAAGGTTQAYFADDVPSLVNILVKEIAGAIKEGSYSRSAPAITSYKPGEDLQLYSTYFDWPIWRGHMKAYDVHPGTGAITGLNAGWVGDCDDTAGTDADAGCVMTTEGRGTVYTSVLASAVGDPIVFDPANAGTVAVLSPFISAPDTVTVMNYILDPGYNGGIYEQTRDKNWSLGDIYHSKPVVVGVPRFTPPPAAGVDPYLGYSEFKTDNAARETLIYVGGNDGMVHAIKDGNGHEKWAYIPNAVLGKLKEIGTDDGGHRFTVDLAMKAADIFSPGGGSTIWAAFAAGDEEDGWHTLLTSGLRQGGYSYFALDVTGATPKVAWEMSDVDADPTTRDMGETWSTPAFGRILIDGEYKYVLFVGGGLSELIDNKGNNFYIIDAASGQILNELDIGIIDNNVPSEVRVLVDTESGSPYYGNIKEVFFGDTKGDLYKVSNLNDDIGGATWAPQATRLFDGVGKVFHKPVISESGAACDVYVDGNLYDIAPNTTFIIYGTGDENGGMMNELSTDRMYAIADPPLLLHSDGTTPLVKLWEYHFATGEKLSSDPFIHLNTVYFATYSPEGGCGKGESFLWGLTIPRCGDAGGEDGITEGSGGGDGGSHRISLGDGMSSEPVHGGPVLYVQTPGGEQPVTIPLPDANKLEYWREEF